MGAYTLKEVSKIINVSTSTLKQWEKDLSDLLVIPRSKQGARIYSDDEINKLLEIKDWEAKNLGKVEIRNMLLQQLPSLEKSESVVFDSALPVLSEIEEQPSVSNDLSKWNQDQFFLTMDQYKQSFLNEVKEEIRSVVRTEVVEEVKKEISKGTFTTVKTLSDSLYKSSANVQEEIKELYFTVQKTSDVTDKTFSRLEKTLTDQAFETSEEFYSISKQLAETSEELSHYIDVTNNEIGTLVESLEKDREYFVANHENLRSEIRQREIAFQGMLSSFRVAASAKERKWWKFW
ncbi:MerR family transcriptional regulator [Bacillus sp. EB600]|uniref:MerR family transcriptional regulator n=1 Tax=Bacillus sp. EB600 TaxID=2806345 RepID=UPI00210B6926|nr:MerR family transcriptional regulator [Bacillus sp. EB600]MCQ6280556.1 MerR family transcriptional regulator [Bacillus sp. EB600]